MTALRKLLIGSVFGFILSFGVHAQWDNSLRYDYARPPQEQAEPSGLTKVALKAVSGGNLASPGPIGGTTPNTGAFTTVTATTSYGGTVSFNPIMDMGNVVAGLVSFKRSDQGVNTYVAIGNDGSVSGVRIASLLCLTWSSSATSIASLDTSICRDSAGGVRFGGGSVATTTSRTELNKAVAGIADNVATATFTITIPNAAHSASILIVPTCSLGAGGAIGAGEATGTISYNVSIARTAGVAAVGTTSTGYGSASSLVAGAATITTTGALSAVSGAVGATNTFTFNVTVARGSGSSTNHTCVMYARLMNANATGITIS